MWQVGRASRGDCAMAPFQDGVIYAALRVCGVEFVGVRLAHAAFS